MATKFVDGAPAVSVQTLSATAMSTTRASTPSRHTSRPESPLDRPGRKAALLAQLKTLDEDIRRERDGGSEAEEEEEQEEPTSPVDVVEVKRRRRKVCRLPAVTPRLILCPMAAAEVGNRCPFGLRRSPRCQRPYLNPQLGARGSGPPEQPRHGGVGRRAQVCVPPTSASPVEC